MCIKVHHIFEIGIVYSLVVRKNGQTTYQILILVSVVSPRCALARKYCQFWLFLLLLITKTIFQIIFAFYKVKHICMQIYVFACKYTFLHANIRIFRTNIHICMQIYVYLEQIYAFACKIYLYLEQRRLFISSLFQFLKRIFEQCARCHFIQQNY